MNNLTEMTISQILEYVHHLESRSGAPTKDIMAMDFYGIRDYVVSLESEISHNETV
jgi:hypothetical protein